MDLETNAESAVLDCPVCQEFIMSAISWSINLQNAVKSGLFIY
jgi:hypothetical protein